MAMGKEAKIGLAVIVVLLVVFAFVLYKKISGDDAPATAATGAAPTKPEDATPSPKRAKLSSGPNNPAAVEAARKKRTGSNAAGAGADAATRNGGTATDDAASGQSSPTGERYAEFNSNVGDRYARVQDGDSEGTQGDADFSSDGEDDDGDAAVATDEDQQPYNPFANHSDDETESADSDAGGDEGGSVEPANLTNRHDAAATAGAPSKKQQVRAQPPSADSSAKSSATIVKSSSNGSHGLERIHLVADGETLFDIARRKLGKASRWVEIYDANQSTIGRNFDRLPQGMTLVLPDAGDEHVTHESQPFTR